MKELLAQSFRALNHRNFRLYWFGHLVSSTGTWTQTVAQAWLVYRLTHSPVMLGLIGFSAQIPIFALSVLGGVFADRWDRRRIIMTAQSISMASAFTLAGLTLSDRIEVWHVFSLALVSGVTAAFDIPARQSLFIHIAGREDLMNAIALNSSAFHTARLVGPAIAALLLASAGEGVCFLVNGLSYFALLGAFIAIGRIDVPRSASGRRLAADLYLGLGFAWKHQAVRYLLALVATTSFWGVSYIVLMPIFAGELLDVGADGLGILMSGSGLGAIAGTLYVASRTGRSPRYLRRLTTSCGAGLGVSLSGFALSSAVWLSFAFAALSGALVITLAATANTYLQLLVPDEIRGRTMSLFTTMFVGAGPLGHLFNGVVADRLGAREAVALAAVAACSGTVLLARRLPDVAGSSTSPDREDRNLAR